MVSMSMTLRRWPRRLQKGLHGNRPVLIGAYVDPDPSRVSLRPVARVTAVTLQTGRTVAVLDAMPPTSRQVIDDIFGPDFTVRARRRQFGRAKRAAAADADVLLTMWGSVDADTIAAAPKAKLIQKLGVGTDKIDSAAASARGNHCPQGGPGINADAVAELAVLLTLAVGRYPAQGHGGRAHRHGGEGRVAGPSRSSCSTRPLGCWDWGTSVRRWPGGWLHLACP